MILVNLFNAPFSLREFHIGSKGIRIGSVRVAQKAFRQARAGRGRGHGRKQVLNTDAFQFGKQAT
jgi:hypothetical protein